MGCVSVGTIDTSADQTESCLYSTSSMQLRHAVSVVGMVLYVQMLSGTTRVSESTTNAQAKYVIGNSHWIGSFQVQVCLH